MRDDAENEKCRAVRVPERPLQRNERVSRRTVSSPTRPNRRGVTVPFRVLPGSEVASLLGYPLPVRPRRSQNARPFRYFFLRPHPRTRLLGRSSHGVRSSFTVFPEISAPGLSTEGTSLGVPSPLQRSWEERVHVPLRLPVSGSLVVPGGSPTSPTLPATVPLTGFPNLSAAFFLSPPSRHFQTGGVLGVSPFRDFPSTNPRRLVVADMPS
jgi:hypothetical protein